jgi:hypothetical protein
MNILKDVERRGLRVPMVALLVGSVWLRYRELGPSSLWQDDAWVVLGATRADGIGEVVLSGVTAPGFSMLLTAWLALTGFSSTAAQFLPFLFAVVAPSLLYLVVVRLGAPKTVATVAGAALVVAPVHVEYATRVKHYSLDTLSAIVVLAVAWAIVEDPASHRRWAALAVTSSVATVLSASVVPVVVGAFTIAGLAALHAGRRARLLSVAGAGGYGVVAAAWTLTVVRPSMNVPLQRYWSQRYLDFDQGFSTGMQSLARAAGHLLGHVSPLPWAAAVLITVGFLWLVARRPTVALAVAVPLLVAVLMAALHLAPLGGGRTDHHLLPSLVLAMGFALEPLHRVRPPAAVAAAGVVVTAFAVSASPSAPYPQQDIRPLAETLDARFGADDALVLHPPAEWAFGLYSEQPVEIVEAPWFIRSWRPMFPDGRVHVLGAHRARLERVRSEIAAVVASQDGEGSVWLLVSAISDDDEAVVHAQLALEGLERVEERRTPGARLTRWEFLNDRGA